MQNILCPFCNQPTKPFSKRSVRCWDDHDSLHDYVYYFHVSSSIVDKSMFFHDYEFGFNIEVIHRRNGKIKSTISHYPVPVNEYLKDEESIIAVFDHEIIINQNIIEFCKNLKIIN